jgi:hypothetical protein
VGDPEHGVRGGERDTLRRRGGSQAGDLGQVLPANKERFFRDEVSGIRYGKGEQVIAAGQEGELLDPDTHEASPPVGVFHLHGLNTGSARIQLRTSVVREARRLVLGKALITVP